MSESRKLPKVRAGYDTRRTVCLPVHWCPGLPSYTHRDDDGGFKRILEVIAAQVMQHWILPNRHRAKVTIDQSIKFKAKAKVGCAKVRQTVEVRGDALQVLLQVAA